MKTHIKLAITLVATAGIQTGWGSDEAEQLEFPVIMTQPTDQGAFAGGSATFAVQAVHERSNLIYQWRRNGVALEGQTNDCLTLDSVAVDDAGLYCCDVATADGEAVPTRAASLSVMTISDGQIIVYGLPRVSSGTIGNCPGTYAGYVNYTKTVAQGWGWAPDTTHTTLFTASDGGGRTNTKVMYLGKFSDTGCGVTTVTIPPPPTSPKYRFTIYFPNHVPTTNYPMILNGFLP